MGAIEVKRRRRKVWYLIHVGITFIMYRIIRALLS